MYTHMYVSMYIHMTYSLSCIHYEFPCCVISGCGGLLSANSTLRKPRLKAGTAPIGIALSDQKRFPPWGCHPSLSLPVVKLCRLILYTRDFFFKLGQSYEWEEHLR